MTFYTPNKPWLSAPGIPWAPGVGLDPVVPTQGTLAAGSRTHRLTAGFCWNMVSVTFAIGLCPCFQQFISVTNVAVFSPGNKQIQIFRGHKIGLKRNVCLSPYRNSSTHTFPSTSFGPPKKTLNVQWKDPVQLLLEMAERRQGGGEDGQSYTNTQLGVLTTIVCLHATLHASCPFIFYAPIIFLPSTQHRSDWRICCLPQCPAPCARVTQTI